MKSFLVTLICLAVCNQLAIASLNVQSEWLLYKNQHGKAYTSAEEDAKRLTNFLASKEIIERHNANSSHTYKMGLNHMADWTREERAALNGMRGSTQSILGRRNLSLEDKAFVDEILNRKVKLPVAVDWTKVPNHVSEVKNQGQCGSCWAFATTGLLEGQQKDRKLTDVLQVLSEQQLVDCSRSNHGCEGGIMDEALWDIHQMGGIMTDCDYPYRAVESHCNYNRSLSMMTVTGGIVSRGNELHLRTLVAQYGPVAVAFYASDHFHYYHSGVYHDEECPEGQINHAVLIVGYGHDNHGGDFWLVKNSWSRSFGECGYFKISRGHNMCDFESIPTIARF